MSTFAPYLFLSDGGMVRHAREDTLDGVRKIARRSPGRLFARAPDGSLLHLESYGSTRDAAEMVREFRTQFELQAKVEAHARRANAASNTMQRIVNGASGGGSGVG